MIFFTMVIRKRYIKKAAGRRSRTLSGRGGGGRSRWDFGRGGLFGAFAPVFFQEAFHPAGSVHQFKLAGVEGMAFGTNFNMQLAGDGGAGLKDIAARTGDLGGAVIGVDFFLQSAFSLQNGL